MSSSLVVIPTFNEKENIILLLDKIKSLENNPDVLVVDDSSPDGTGQLVEDYIKENRFVKILHRKTKDGLGKAYVAGFKWALEKNYQKIISMDADFSHPYSKIPKLIEICNSKTVAIGSRYIHEGKITGWTFDRYLNSWGANLVTRMILQIKAKDATAGFKCYPAEFFKKINLDKVQSSGYAFQVEMLLLAQDNGFNLSETPIVFEDRKAGESKIKGELIKSAKIVFSLASQRKGLRQFVKFGIVGFINTLVDWAIYYPLKISFGNFLPNLSLQEAKQVAKAISFIFSAISSYAMNRKWTFRSANKNVSAEALKFGSVAIVGLLINNLVLYFATSILGWRDIFGLILATAAATLWNFFVNKKWTFQQN